MKEQTNKTICLVIGDPVDHSLSPAMHNAGYKKLAIDNAFEFTKQIVKKGDLAHIIKKVRIKDIRGLTCTIPHKVDIISFLDELDPTAKRIGAVNSVVNEHGKLKGYNTDWLGIITPLEKKLGEGGLIDKKVALLGAGGAARAAAFGVTKLGAKLTIYNRTLEKAEDLAKEFNAQVRLLDQQDDITQADIIINSTPLGMGTLQDLTPINPKFLQKSQIIFDNVYVPYMTELLRQAKQIGATVIPGLEMLLYQGIAQFELYTKQKAPEQVMRQVLLDHYKINETT